jgi:diguanylate cyclase (GGDEF)-like protein/PAS domain S-box-containing protein
MKTAMEYQEHIFEALLINNPVAIVTLDMEGKVIYCNPAFEKLFGYTTNEIIGNSLDLLISTPENYFETINYTKRIISKGETIRATGKRRKKDRTLVDVEIQGIPIFVSNEQRGILALYHDITDRIRAEESSRDIYSTFVHIMDSIDADVYVADMQTYKIIFMNQHMRHSFGSDLVGKTCYGVFRQEAKPCSICTNPRLLDQYGNPVGEVVWEGQNPVTRRWYKNFDRAIAWGDGYYVRLQVATDITDIKETEQRLYFLATHDPLTQLPNRVYFMEQLSMLVKPDRKEQTQFAVIFLDIDNFKSVNDQFGHDLGDRLLLEASKRMKMCLRDHDILARVSGDEFIFILSRIPAKKIVHQVVDRLVKSISMPYLIEGNEICITVSMGVSFYPDDGTYEDQLLQRSDEAMYRVKNSGKNGYCFYEQLNQE